MRPSPGSEEAREQGCLCALSRDSGEPKVVVHNKFACPIHGPFDIETKDDVL